MLYVHSIKEFQDLLAVATSGSHERNWRHVLVGCVHLIVRPHRVSVYPAHHGLAARGAQVDAFFTQALGRDERTRQMGWVR
jgi:hypothetical protein